MLGRNESGRSMIEMLGVLAIIGILSAGGIAGYTMAMKNYRANKALETLQLTSTQIITAYAGNDDFSNLNNDTIDKLKVDITNPYGTNLGVKGSAGSFKLIMENVPGQACLKIAQAPWGDQYVVGDGENVTKFTVDPFACDDENTNTIVFTYLANANGSASSGGCFGGSHDVCAEYCMADYYSCVESSSEETCEATIIACYTTNCSGCSGYDPDF